MFTELLCGLVIYRLFWRCFYDDDTLDVETTDSDAKFLVANRIETLYDGKVYFGLRIPDADTGSRQSIDMVLVKKKEAVVISVKNFAGTVQLDANGRWICTGENKRKAELLPDPVVETKRQVAILESYLEQRGVILPEGFLSARVVLPNPKCRIIHPENFPLEVISFDKWVQLKPETKSTFSSWIKDAFRTGKKEMQESIHQKLHFILSSAPIWDRLELRENKKLLGEFREFRGMREDAQALSNIRRSKVSQLVIQRSTVFGIGGSKLQVLYSNRDYRSEGTSSHEWKEITVRSSTVVLFQPQNSNNLYKFRLSSITSMTLCA